MENNGNLHSESGTKLISREKIREPQKGMVILINDDYTTMEFVVSILIGIFHKDAREADNIMWSVHKNGRGECGLYPLDIAETKVNHVHALARKAGFPLRCVIELI